MSTDTAVQGSRLLLDTLRSTAVPVRIVRVDPIKRAREQLILALAEMPLPRLPTSPDPEHFDHVSEHLVTFAEIVDRYLAVVGEEVRSHATTKVDVKLFTGQLSGALIGNATWICTDAAQALREERAEAAA